MIQTDVVRRIFPAVESDGRSDNKGNRFGFGLAYRLGGCDAPLGKVQHRMCEFMHKGGELFGGGLSGKQDDLVSAAHAQSWGNALLEFQRDSLPCDEFDQPFPAFAYVAAHL